MVSYTNGGSSVSLPSEPQALLYEDIRTRISQHDFETWFQGTPCDFYHPGRFVFTAANRFRKAWMEKNYRELLLSSARALFELDPQIEFQVKECAAARQGAAWGTALLPQEAGPPLAAGEPRPGVRRDPAVPSRLRSAAAPRSVDVPKLSARDLNPEFVFDNFVVGPSNRVAHAAAIAVSEKPGRCYNPLFIYGDLGVGKTHLLQAICHQLFKLDHPRVTFFTSEAFTSQFVRSLSDSRLEAFRAQCRSGDVLVIDDVQFLANKDRTQDELFHTLNDMLASNKQVIISSVCSPRGTSGIQERLASRFKWGLLARLERPDFETRVAILLRRAHMRNLELPTEVAEFIAKHVVDSLRELEGALARVISVSSLTSSPLDIETARSALEEILQEEHTAGTITIAQILQAIQEYYQIKAKDLLSRSKVRALVHARQIGMYLARKLTPLSLEEIGMHFGGRDHTTVIYALERMESFLETKAQVRGDLQLLKNRISAHRAS